MADRADRNRWIMNAQDACGKSNVSAQIAWLRTKRAEFAVSVDSGDWAAEEISGDGGSSKSVRGVSDKANHDAIMDALRHLGDTDLGSTGSLLQVQFYPAVG